MKSQIELSCHGRTVDGPFGLLSRNENGLTFALGYLFSSSPQLLMAVLRRFGLSSNESAKVQRIKLQRMHLQNDEDPRGITDIEVDGDDFYVVLEAKKKGWPEVAQLERYAGRFEREHKRMNVLCALGVPPICDSQCRNWIPSRSNIRFYHLRWHEILETVRSVIRSTPTGISARPLIEYSRFIEEVIQMQYYDTEVLVRDVTFDDPSRDLYFDHYLYNGGDRGGSESLFFAPNFTKTRKVPLGLDGIQFMSRVYFRSKFNVNDRVIAHRALKEARNVIEAKIARLTKRQGAKETIEYLKMLPTHWERGVRQLPKIGPKDEKNVNVLFLGEPMRLPVPVKKKGGMIAPGFGIPLEFLLSVESKTFNC